MTLLRQLLLVILLSTSHVVSSSVDDDTRIDAAIRGGGGGASPDEKQIDTPRRQLSRRAVTDSDDAVSSSTLSLARLEDGDRRGFYCVKDADCEEFLERLLCRRDDGFVVRCDRDSASCRCVTLGVVDRRLEDLPLSSEEGRAVVVGRDEHEVKSLETPFTGFISGQGNMFTVLPLRDMTILGLSVKASAASSFTVQVYTHTGTYFHDSAATRKPQWNLVLSTGIKRSVTRGMSSLTSLPDFPTPVPVRALTIQSFYVTSPSPVFFCSYGVREGKLWATNEDMFLFSGTLNKHEFEDSSEDFAWNGGVRYVRGITEGTGLPARVATRGPRKKGKSQMMMMMTTKMVMKMKSKPVSPLTSSPTGPHTSPPTKLSTIAGLPETVTT
eukprot:CAMPEP_0172488650 /NCGR_PEP_ID=MMETSP1066-20121228/18287_1 /TAXON_ID=671091 /ORGANISM="Coscinodiscus wailesii, Strain CCMP2513" /LENGTH=383 /DNA_ID=CAMNT_0013256011 /DNA_START=194 /DNA_END=1341 /DNA_ORIENTATION=+